MRLNEYFDKIFCINLDKRIDKWLLSKKEFQKHDLIVDRFIAIEGNPDKIKTHLTDGGVGCTISHLEVFKLSKLLNLKNVLILEDDVDFIDDLNDRFNEYYKQIHENWGLLYLGGNHNGMPIQKISENMAMITNTYTTHAYAVNNNIYDELINTFFGISDIADILLAKVQNKLKNSYVFQPHLAWQKPGYSDVLNVYADYDFLKTGFFKTM